jgi:hypothetical protein
VYHHAIRSSLVSYSMKMLGSICRAHSSVRLPVTRVTAAREIIECLILGTKQPHDFQHSIFDANGSKLNIIYKILFASYILGGKEFMCSIEITFPFRPNAPYMRLQTQCIRISSCRMLPDRIHLPLLLPRLSAPHRPDAMRIERDGRA